MSPREKITEDDFTWAGENVGILNHRRHVHVGWAKGNEWVQVHVEVTIDELRDMLATAEREAEAAFVAYMHDVEATNAAAIAEGDVVTLEGEPPRFARVEALSHDDYVANQTFHVVSAVLTRPETNRLVSTLRTARDGAFGRDQ